MMEEEQGGERGDDDVVYFFFQAEDGIRDFCLSLGSEMCIRDSS